MVGPQYVREGFATRDYFNETTLHPLGLAALLVLGAATFVLPRRKAAIPLLLMACFVAPAQRVVIATLDFTLLRLLITIGLVRILSRGELSKVKWGKLDRAVFVWMGLSSLAFVLLRGAFVQRAGYALDAVGAYVFLRVVLRDWRDYATIVKSVALISLVVAVFFTIEHYTARNLFHFLGGVPEITHVRDGRLRCQGPFPHAILAGCFWASLIPIVAAAWWGKMISRGLVAASCVAMVIIVLFCASSTPVMGLGAAGFAGVMFRARGSMRAIRWGALLGLVFLHFSMRAPVWHLVSRIDLVGGSTGWHRYYLIDQTIKRVSEWAMLGVTSTAHWGRGLFDITNQFVLEAVHGGMLGLIAFVVLIGFAFGQVGKIWRAGRPAMGHMMPGWALGASLFAQCSMFFAISISHSRQNVLIWFLVLALIGSLSEKRQLASMRAEQWNRQERKRRRRAPDLALAG